MVLYIDGKCCFNFSTVANYINTFYTTVTGTLVKKLSPAFGKFDMDSETIQDYHKQMVVTNKGFKLSLVASDFVLKGCGMGPWLVLVSPCFRENVVATWKIGSFLCSLDNLLQKNVIDFFLGNQISKWRLFEKKGYF